MIAGLGMIGRLGIRELLVILAVIVFLFGAARVPQMARSFGKWFREFRKARKAIGDEIEYITRDKPKDE